MSRGKRGTACRGPVDRRRMTRAGCDNTSAGVLITGDDGRYLMSARIASPAGIAPPAGHVSDWGGGYPDAARALVAAELRVPVKSLDPAAAGGWRAGRCGRPPGPRGAGHEWQIYAATASGTADPPRGRARQPRWLDPAEIQQLAARTAQYAHGQITDGQFHARPGIEPAWVAFLAELGIITMAKHDLTAIDRAAQTRR